MKTAFLKSLLTILVLSTLYGCASMEANKRATISSVVRIAGMDMANGGGLGPSFAIIGENDVVLPTDQQYLMTLEPYMPKFMNIGFGSYRFMANSKLLSTVPKKSTLRIKPLGFAKTNRLVMFYVVSAEKSEVGKKISAKVRTGLVQSVNGGKPVSTAREDVINFSVADVSAVDDDIDGWQEKVLLMEKAPAGAKDLGMVEVKPGKLIWADRLEPYSKLKDKAWAKGANVMTDLELISAQDQQGGITATFGFRAHAWEVAER